MTQALQRVPWLLRVVFFGASFLGIFVFAYPFTLLLTFCAALIFPPYALFIGFLYELFYNSGHSMPKMLIWGLVLYLLALFVRYIARTRIM